MALDWVTRLPHRDSVHGPRLGKDRDFVLADTGRPRYTRCRVGLYACWLTALLAAPALAAHDPILDDRWGVVLLYRSIPIAAGGFVLSSFLAILEKFVNPRLLAAYFGLWCLGFVVLLVLAALSDTTSTWIVAIGDGALLIIVLLPAIHSYHRFLRDSAKPEPPSDPDDSSEDQHRLA